MNPETIALVRQSWAKVEPIAPQAAALFYSNLFSADPSIQTLFKGDMVEQGTRLMQMIGVAVSKLDDAETLIPALQALGRRHRNYAVLDAHYPVVGAALLKTLEQGLGSAFTPSVRAAWTEVYSVIAKVMTEAAKGA